MLQPPPDLLEVVPTGLLVDQIKERLRAKVSSHMAPNSLVGIYSILLINDNRFLAPATRGCLGQKLRLAALVHADEPEDGLIDCPPGGQQAVVL